MRYGFYLPTRGRSAEPDALEALVERGEALGFHSTVIADHVVFPVAIASKYPYTDRKSTRLNSSHGYISYAVFCLKKKTQTVHRGHPLYATLDLCWTAGQEEGDVAADRRGHGVPLGPQQRVVREP